MAIERCPLRAGLRGVEGASVKTMAGLRIVLVGPVPPPSGGMANQTRALAALLAGSFGEAAHLNILVVALLPLTLAASAYTAYQAARWNRWTPLIPAGAAAPLLVVAIVFGIARNLAPRLLGP